MEKFRTGCLLKTRQNAKMSLARSIGEMVVFRRSQGLPSSQPSAGGQGMAPGDLFLLVGPLLRAGGLGPQFPHLHDGDPNSAHSAGLLSGLSEMGQKTQSQPSTTGELRTRCCNDVAELIRNGRQH